MFNVLAAAPRGRVDGFRSTDNTLRVRASANTAADTNWAYSGHISVPKLDTVGLATDWRVRFSVVYETGVHTGSPSESLTGPSTVDIRFHVRITNGLENPQSISAGAGLYDASAGNGYRGGQVSLVVAAQGGSGGNAVNATSTYVASGEFSAFDLALNKWVDDYTGNGFALSVFNRWTGSANNHAIRVVSVSLDLIPGTSRELVTTPRTLPISLFGGHWEEWQGATAPQGYLFGAARFFADWFNIETFNWTGATNAAIDADPGWAKMDAWVAAHSAIAGRVLTASISGTPSRYGPAVNQPPTDLGSGAASSWSRFCRAVGRRYAGKGIIYEIWNEGNMTGHPLIGFNGTTAQFASLHVQAATELRGQDSSCKIATTSFVNIMSRGSINGVADAKALLTYNSGQILALVDYVAFHAYPFADGTNDTIPAMYANNMRSLLTQLGAPNKPTLMTEFSTGGPNWSDLPVDARRRFLQRSVLHMLLGDPNLKLVAWYGLNQTNFGWAQGDTDVWNSMVSFIVSGPITRATVNQDGTIDVTVGTNTRTF